MAEEVNFHGNSIVNNNSLNYLIKIDEIPRLVYTDNVCEDNTALHGPCLLLQNMSVVDSESVLIKNNKFLRNRSEDKGGAINIY